MHITRFVVAIAAGLLPLGAAAQTKCQGAGYDDFDFWVGEWTVQWTNPDGSAAQGVNRIRRSHAGCVILEEFDGAPGSPLQGMSVSTWDPRKRVWKQTWVDNNGSYLDFEGGVVDGDAPTRLVLARRTEVNGQPIRQRMVFRDVAADRLVWDWQRSRDEGVTWETQWTIRYARRTARSP